jgi:hypothetical protein
MPGQETCAPPVIVTLPAQITAATAEQAAGQISAAFASGVTVVIADLTATACNDRSAIRHLLRAHRKATARGGQVRFAIRTGGSLHRITEFADIHPLLAVYPTLQRAIKADYPGHPAIAPSRRPPSPHGHLSGLRSWPDRAQTARPGDHRGEPPAPRSGCSPGGPPWKRTTENVT